MADSDGPKGVALRLRFRSEVGRIPAALDQVMRFVKLSGCVLGQEIEVELALGEALNNAVVHGNLGDPDKWVSLRCRCDRDDGVSIVVRDEGRGFDRRRVPEAPAPGSREPESGLGLLIMRSYMDGVSFEKGGTEVHLRKSPAISRNMRVRVPDEAGVQPAPHALHPTRSHPGEIGSIAG
jgi:serine/threonine-protein kinase RsbW